MKEYIKEYMNARNVYMNYAMKITYGPIEDRIYNTEMANKWDEILKELRNKIYEQYTDRHK
jgi:hypothetical protein